MPKKIIVPEGMEPAYANLARISRAARKAGPFIYGVYDDELKRLHP